jgi:NADH dehydrogenase
MKKIVILGAGVAGIKIYKDLHKRLCSSKECNVNIALVNDTNYFTFVPMLHEAATGGVEEAHVSTPLREIAACHNHDVYVRQITSMDPVKQVVKTDKGDISYDYVVVATGSKTNYFGTKGAKEYAHAIRTLDDARALRTHLNELFEEASEAQKRDQQRLMHIVVIGGGAVGVQYPADGVRRAQAFGVLAHPDHVFAEEKNIKQRFVVHHVVKILVRAHFPGHVAGGPKGREPVRHGGLIGLL